MVYFKKELFIVFNFFKLKKLLVLDMVKVCNMVYGFGFIKVFKFIFWFNDMVIFGKFIFFLRILVFGIGMFGLFWSLKILILGKLDKIVLYGVFFNGELVIWMFILFSFDVKLFIDFFEMGWVLF